MDAEVYPDPEVAGFIREQFVPFRAHVKEQGEVFQRFGAEWTPTAIVADADGTERHRFEGFLPKPDLLAQLRLGLAHAARARHEYADAEKRYRELADGGGPEDIAAEAQYWAGVSRYKATNDPSGLTDTAKAFRERFANTTWAKKASVWS
ncbi:MAG TPA: thioredoxin family protein [Thermoanaerobaculia bacterium]|nr:thioredoxin family protein [Thermoanaerobaculia bacterium]